MKHISPVSFAGRSSYSIAQVVVATCVALTAACASRSQRDGSVVGATDVAQVDVTTEEDGSDITPDVATDTAVAEPDAVVLDAFDEPDVPPDLEVVTPDEVTDPPDIEDLPDTPDESDVHEPPDVVDVPDVAEVLDVTDTAEPDVVTTTGIVSVELDGKAASIGADGTLTVVLPTFTPGDGAASVATLVIRNAGAVPFTVAGASVLALNLDGTEANPLVTLGTVGKPLPALPADVLPAAQVPTAKVTLPIEFRPDSIQAAVDAGGNHATVYVSLAGADMEALVVRIEVPQFEPDIVVSPSTLEFTTATLSLAETLTVTIENVGNAPLSLSSISLSPPLERFTVSEFTPGVLGPAGSNTATTTFLVSYKPIITSTFDETTLVIVSDDPDEPTATVALSSTFEPSSSQSPCVVTWPGQESGVLDFSDAKIGVPKLLTVEIENAGIGICTLNGVSVPEDPDGVAYNVSVYSKSPAGDPSPVSVYPLGIGMGYKFLIDVVYTTTSAAKSATLMLDLDDPLPKVIELPMIGGGPKPCFDMGPGTPAAPEPLQFAGNPGDAVTRHIALYSCGDAPVAIGPAMIVDAPGDGEVFTAGSLPSEIGKNGVVWFSVTATFEPGATDAVGELTIPYSLEKGSATITVPLRRRILGATKLPTAEPGDTSKYAGVVASQPFTLDATASTAGSLPLNSSGYLWTLVSKPAGSTLIVAGVAGSPLQVVTPDLPGSYVFSLVVKSAGTLPWFSIEKTVTVNVN